MTCTLVNFKEHPRLNEALETNKIVFAYDRCKNGGSKFYRSLLCVHQQNIRQKLEYKNKCWSVVDRDTHDCNCRAVAANLSRHSTTRYEIIYHGIGFPIRLFFDIEWPRSDSVADNLQNNGVAILLRLLNELLPQFMGYKAEYIVMDSCRTEKISYHVVFPNVIATTVRDHLKVFAVLFVAWLRENHGDNPTLFYPHKKSGQPTSIIDVCVYRNHGLFRMQNQYKLSDPNKTQLILRPDWSTFKKPEPHDCLLQVLDAARVTDNSTLIDSKYVEQMRKKCNYNNLQIFKRGRSVAARSETAALPPPQPVPSTSSAVVAASNVLPQQHPHDTLRITRRGKDDHIRHRIEWKQLNETIYIHGNIELIELFDSKMLRSIDYSQIYLRAVCDLLQYLCGCDGERDGGKERAIEWMDHTKRPKALSILFYVEDSMHERVYAKNEPYFSFLIWQLRLQYKRVVDVRPYHADSFCRCIILLSPVCLD